MVKAPYESAVESAFGVISELITDDDLAVKINFEMQKLKFELDKTLLATQTNPKTDAFVKILIAMRDIVIPMFRPVGSLAMAGFAAYCRTEGIALPEYIEVMLWGAPIGYGVSRHSDKKQAEQTKRLTNRTYDPLEEFTQ